MRRLRDGVSRDSLVDFTLGIIMNSHMSKMRDNAIVGNIGHFDNEIAV